MISRTPALVANGHRLVAAGVSVIHGTEAGIAPVRPPDVVRWTIGQFQQLGLNTAQALHVCTARAGAALGLGDRKGAPRPGYDADLLAVDGNPLDNPAAYTGSGRSTCTAPRST
jgi:imidazolonepropionase-like amidohydrolase